MLKNSLKNKTALITGGVKRIGRKIASTLAEHGANVIIHYNNSSKPKVDAFLKELSKFNIRSWKIKADFADLDETIGVFKKIGNDMGHVDILINNSSTFKRSDIKTLTPEVLYNTLNINAVSPLILSQAFASQTKKGTIINILDTKIKDYNLAYGAYQLSKKLLHSITEMTAISFAPNIRVNGIAPGIILPPIGEAKKLTKKLETFNLMMKRGSPKDISETVLFLINNEFITGEVIFVDGGQHLKTHL